MPLRFLNDTNESDAKTQGMDRTRPQKCDSFDEWSLLSDRKRWRMVVAHFYAFFLRWIDDLGQDTNANRSDMNERSCLCVADDIVFMLVRFWSRLIDFRNESELIGEGFVPSGFVSVAEVNGFAV